MIYNPQKYKIEDKPELPFIDNEEIFEILQNTKSDKIRVREVIEKSLSKNRLSLEETAVLINANDSELIEEIKNAANLLKNTIYDKKSFR